jgi:hypothetical protein
MEQKKDKRPQFFYVLVILSSTKYPANESKDSTCLTERRNTKRGVGTRHNAVLSAVLWIRSSFNADPNPAFYLNADPDPGSQTNTDPSRSWSLLSPKVEIFP